MRVYLINPSESSFGTSVITPRWMYVLAGATPAIYGDPVIADETLDPFDMERLQPGDVIKLGMHEITYSRADLPAEPGDEARATQTTLLQDSDYDDDPDADEEEEQDEAPYSSIARGSSAAAPR